MDTTGGLITLQLPLLIVALGMIGVIAWNQQDATASIASRAHSISTKVLARTMTVGLWLLLTAASIWLVFLYGLAVSYVALFWLGRLAAGVSIVFFGFVVLAVPVAWGWALLRLNHR